MRGRETKLEDRLDLVWTGPEGPGTASRDTAAVVRELFATAERHVLLSGYVVYKGLEVFEVLARRMDESPALSVRMFLNVDRPAGDTSLAVEIVKRFAADFALKQWPGTRRPEVFYDPRALSSEPGKHAVLHAKCLVVDHETALVSSANFTPAALERNIEAGVLLRSASFAARLEAHFESLVTAGVLRRLDFADASGCP
jgi:phosphatidylserine/phosphatidylglycerophosphate/cardiolipin synthase-like enzyme